MIPQRQTGASSRARETHGVMPNPRQVASEGKRSPSSKSALHKGFRTYFGELGNGESPMWERGQTVKTAVSESGQITERNQERRTELSIHVP
jgi:hypothetical protein